MFKKINSLVEEDSGYFVAYISDENNDIIPVKFLHYPSLKEVKSTYEEVCKKIEEEKAKQEVVE